MIAFVVFSLLQLGVRSAAQLGVVGIALAGAQSELALSPAWLGALGGGSLAGLLVGALVCGPVGTVSAAGRV